MTQVGITFVTLALLLAGGRVWGQENDRGAGYLYDEAMGMMDWGEFIEAELLLKKASDLDRSSKKIQAARNKVAVVRKQKPDLFWRSAVLKSIRIREVKFSEATLDSVVRYMQKTYDEAAQGTKYPPLNIVLFLGDFKPAPITLQLRNVTLWDLLRHSTEMAGVKYKFDDNAIVLRPAQSPEEGGGGLKL